MDMRAILEYIKFMTETIGFMSAFLAFLIVLITHKEVLNELKNFLSNLWKAKFFHSISIFFVLISLFFIIVILMNPSQIDINYSSDTAHIEEYINGTAKNILGGQEIWILVYPLTADKYYPICKAYTKNAEWSLFRAFIKNAEWSLPYPVHLGTESDTGKKFDIIAVLADREAQDEFANYFKTGEETGKWPGMPRIPDASKEYDRVTVIRDPARDPVEKSTLLPEIKISFPSHVRLNEYIIGNAKNIPDGHKIWILVLPHDVNKYYPQSEATIQNGEWSLEQPVGIGSKNDTGKKFDILAVLADKKAQDEFANYFKTGEETGKWPGMDKIPDSAKEYANITVIRDSLPEITIDYNPKTAHIEEVMNGTAKSIPREQKIWIVVYPHTANKYYPQGEAYVQNERWGLPYPVRIGDPNNTSTQFNILAVLADKKAQEEFKAYSEREQNGQWMWKLPAGTKECANITVTRV